MATRKRQPKHRDEPKAAKRKKKVTKTARKIWPTLIDPETEKEASLADVQAARALLVAVVERIGVDNRWESVLSLDSTDRIGCELLRKYGGPQRTLKAIREVAWLGELLADTSLEEMAGKLPKRSAETPTQSPLPRGQDLETLQSDASEAIAELFPIMRNRVELTGGEKSQSIGLAITWNPPSKNREGYFSVNGNLTVSVRRRTRTAVVQKKRGGGDQLVLFAEPAE